MQAWFCLPPGAWLPCLRPGLWRAGNAGMGWGLQACGAKAFAAWRAPRVRVHLNGHARMHRGMQHPSRLVPSARELFGLRCGSDTCAAGSLHAGHHPFLHYACFHWSSKTASGNRFRFWPGQSSPVLVVFKSLQTCQVSCEGAMYVGHCMHGVNPAPINLCCQRHMRCSRGRVPLHY